MFDDAVSRNEAKICQFFHEEPEREERRNKFEKQQREKLIVIYMKRAEKGLPLFEGSPE